MGGKDLRPVHHQRAADQGAKLCIQPEKVFGDLPGRWETASDQQPVRESYQTVRDGETGLALRGYPQRSEGQRSALHTGGKRKGQRSGCVWVSKVLIDGDVEQLHPEHPEVIDRYLPWSAELSGECRLKYRAKEWQKR